MIEVCLARDGAQSCQATQLRPAINFIAHRRVDTLLPCTPRLAMQFKRIYTAALLRASSMREAPG